MFDLDQQIKNWRAKWLESESVVASDVDELEAHLRDSIEELTRASTGLSQEESFWLATRRVGSPEAVSLEFSKINGARTWIRRAQWMFAGYLGLSLLFRFICTAGHALTFAAVYFHAPLWLAFAVSSTSVSLCAAVLVLWIWNLANGRSLVVQPMATRFSTMVRSGQKGWLILAVMAFVTVAGAFRMLTAALFAKLFAPEEYGVASLILSSSNAIASMLLIATITGLLCWLVANDGRETPAKWSASRVMVGTLMMAIVVSVGFGLLSFGVETLYGPNVTAILE